MCVYNISDATEMLALSYVLGLGGKRDFARGNTVFASSNFLGDASWRWCCRCFWGYVWEKEKFTIWFDFEWICQYKLKETSIRNSSNMKLNLTVLTCLPKRELNKYYFYLA